MTDQEIDEQIDRIHRVAKIVNRSPEAARQFLIKAGIFKPEDFMVKVKKIKKKK